MKTFVKSFSFFCTTVFAALLAVGNQTAVAQSDPKAQKDSVKLHHERQEVKADNKAIAKDVTHGNMKKAKGDYNEMRADKKEMKAAKKQTKIDKKEMKKEKIEGEANQ